MESNAVEPDPHQALLVAQRSHQIWSGYLETIPNQTGIIAESCVCLENMLGPTPALPLGWLQYIQRDDVRHYRDGSSELYLSGQGCWQDTASSCQLDSKSMAIGLLVGIQTPGRFKLVEDARFQKWPGVIGYNDPADGNYLALLVFAWAYILSAYWVEVSTADAVSSPSSTEYATPEPEDCIDAALELDIGPANALTWWRAITSPGQGWRSTVQFDDVDYQSPWSISVPDDLRIKFRASCASPNGLHQHQHLHRAPPSSGEALDFLISFCDAHDVYDQCFAALSVALLLPTAGGRVNQLPTPKSHRQRQHHNFSSKLREEAARIPYYMCISCNTRGVQALLSQPFFDASIACNLTSAWLDPMFRILDQLRGKNDYNTFLNVPSQRAPPIAPLWLGAMLIGFERFALQTARLGTPIVELIAAAWVGIDMSFITTHQIEKSPPNTIWRADECRFLFFMNCFGYERPPICPWRPFGVVPLEEAELEVKVHSSCGHVFKYCGWVWDSKLYANSNSLDAGYRQVLPCSVAVSKMSGQTTATEISSNVASETATRSIFSWLRIDGWPVSEKHIREHEWISRFGHDSDDGESISSGSTKSCDSKSIQRWLLQIQ